MAAMPLLAAFVVLAFATGALAGIGGPGGALLIAALFAVLSLSPGETAGTASAVFVAAAAVAGAAYARSGDVDWHMVAVLLPTTVAGTQVGASANASLPDRLFGVALAALLVALGLRIVYEEARGIDPVVALDARSIGGVAALAALGFGVGFAGGLTGIGGPALATPALVALGVPALVAIGTAQVQSLAVTSATAAAYLSRGTVRPSLVLVLAPAFVAGIVAGWYAAHRVTATRLRLAIGAALLLLAPLIAL